MSIPKYIAEPFKGRVLIICGSPLQVLIAERIIALHPEVSFDAILVSASLNGRSKKYDYYLSRLQLSCHKVFYIHREEGINRTQIYLQIMRMLFLGMRLPKYETIFLGPATDDIEPLLCRQNEASIITLDEGAANLTSKSYKAVTQTNRGRLINLISSVFGVPRLDSFRKRAYMHISIRIKIFLHLLGIFSWCHQTLVSLI